MLSRRISTRASVTDRRLHDASVRALLLLVALLGVTAPKASAETAVPEWQRVLGGRGGSVARLAPEEPAGLGPVPISDERLPHMSWELPSTLTMEGLNGVTSSLRVPVPPGPKPQGLRGSIRLPRGVASGSVRVGLRSGGTELATKRVLVPQSAKLSGTERKLDFSLAIPDSASLRAVDSLSLSVTPNLEPEGVSAPPNGRSGAGSSPDLGEQAAPPQVVSNTFGTCGTIPFSVTDISTQMKGESLPLNRVDDLFAAPRNIWPSTTALDIVVPDSPSSVETNAVLQTAAALGDSLRGAPKSARIRVSTKLPTPIPNLAPAEARSMPIVLIDQDAPQGVHFSKSSDGRPAAVFGGNEKELSDATRLLWRPEHRGENDRGLNPTNAETSYTFDELGIGTVGAESIDDLQFSFGVSQSMLGGSVSGASFDLHLRHRALFPSENAVATVSLGSGISRSVRLRADGQSVRIDLPKNAISRDVKASVKVIQQNSETCDQRKPLRVEIVGSSTVIATPGEALPVRFERFPQVLQPTFGVEIASTDPLSLSNAALLISELGRVSDRPLRPLLLLNGKVWSRSQRTAGLLAREVGDRTESSGDRKADAERTIVRVGDPVRQLDLGELAATQSTVRAAARPGAQLLARVEGQRNVLALEWTNASEAGSLVGGIAAVDEGLLGLTGNTALLRTRGFDDFALSTVTQVPRAQARPYGVFGKALGVFAFLVLIAGVVRYVFWTRPRRLVLYRPVANAPLDLLPIDDEMIQNDEAWADIVSVLTAPSTATPSTAAQLSALHHAGPHVFDVVFDDDFVGASDTTVATAADSQPDLNLLPEPGLPIGDNVALVLSTLQKSPSNEELEAMVGLAPRLAPRDEADLDDSEFYDSEFYDSEFDDSEFDDSEFDDSEFYDSDDGESGNVDEHALPQSPKAKTVRPPSRFKAKLRKRRS